jgi:isopentenyldiphosphate isomerase
MDSGSVNSDASHARHLKKLNREFRDAIRQDYNTLCGKYPQTRGRHGRYQGQYISVRHLAELIAIKLAESADAEVWTTARVEGMIKRPDLAPPADAQQRQLFLEGVQQVIDECFEIAHAVRSPLFRARAHSYVKKFLGMPPAVTPYRPFGLDTTSIGFYKIVDWNRNRSLIEADNVGAIKRVPTPRQDWIDADDLQPYLDAEEMISRGSPCPSLVGYDEDTRETSSQKLELRVTVNSYYRHVAVGRYLRDHPDVYERLAKRVQSSAPTGGLRGMIQTAPRSNIAINVTVLDRDGDLLLLRRSQNTRLWSGFYQAGPHETMNWPSSGEQPENCFALARRALAEEVGIESPAEYYESIIFSWFGLYLPEASGYFFAHVATKLSKSELVELVQAAHSAFETDDVAWLDPTSANITRVVDSWRTGPWQAGTDDQGRQFLPHTAVSVTQLSRVMNLGMLDPS